MAQKSSGLTTLLLDMMKIGCIGFGGGNALIPVMHKVIVKDRGMVSEREFEEDVVVASITPGALPVEIAGGTGSRVGEWRGMLLGAGGMAFPGVCLTILCLAIMSELSPEIMRQVEFVTVGIMAFIACLLTDYLVTTMRRAPDARMAGRILLVIAVVFLLTCGKTLYRLLGIQHAPFFGMATIHVFAIAFFLIFFLYGSRSLLRKIVSAALCVLYALCVGRNNIIGGDAWFYGLASAMTALAVYGAWSGIQTPGMAEKISFRETLREFFALFICVVLAATPATIATDQSFHYLWNGFLSSLLSFGGGDAYLTVADGLFVDTGMITEDEFFGSIVPLVNLFPGSILCKTLSAVGYYVGWNQCGTLLAALAVSVAGFVCSIAASCGVFSLIRCAYQGVDGLELFHVIRQAIRPIVSGLMLTVILALVWQARKTGILEELDWLPVILMAVLFFCDCWLYFFRNASNVRILAFSAGMAVVVCNLAKYL